MTKKPYPLIDLFAGPGGLGEGFSSLVKAGKRAFDVSVSIERDQYAYQTLLLRHFFKSFEKGKVPKKYYQYLSGEITKQELFAHYPNNFSEAKRRAYQISLGRESHDEVKKIIDERLKGQKKWALIGGPPCQAYSLVGRSRMKSNPDFEEDERHFLYKEYLKTIFDHKPPVFVMENVKGLLSAKIKNEPVINRIVKDLSSPQFAISGVCNGLQYKLYSLSNSGEVTTGVDPKHFVVRAEEHGVPQARHRMFIVGIRADVDVKPRILRRKRPPSVKEVIGNLPKLRSSLSRRKDNPEELVEAIRNIKKTRWYRNASRKVDIDPIVDELDKVLEGHSLSRLPCADTRYVKPKSLVGWYFDRKLRKVTHHETRPHMEGDLHRYLFAAAYAKVNKVSPKLKDFPEELLPDHQNVDIAVEGKMFSDRFRVQLSGKYSTTVTSHISKDGHYFIHYDSRQCRSLTVREAARLQTFPDNYHFEGPRTSRYHQVGNAVPPYLAHQISRIIKDVLDQI